MILNFRECPEKSVRGDSIVDIADRANKKTPPIGSAFGKVINFTKVYLEKLIISDDEF